MSLDTLAALATVLIVAGFTLLMLDAVLDEE